MDNLKVNKVYQGDSLEILKNLPDNSIDGGFWLWGQWSGICSIPYSIDKRSVMGV